MYTQQVSVFLRIFEEFNDLNNYRLGGNAEFFGISIN